MPLFLDPVQTGSTGGRPSGNGLTIGLVNNMPDSACHATERQFLTALRARLAAAPKNSVSAAVLRLKTHG